MPAYLYEGTYSAESWAGLVADPRDIAEVLRPGIEKFGGKVVACYQTVLKYEPIGFVEFPDYVAAGAWVMSMVKQPGVTGVKLTPLVTTQEGMQAQIRARDVGGNGGW